MRAHREGPECLTAQNQAWWGLSALQPEAAALGSSMQSYGGEEQQVKGSGGAIAERFMSEKVLEGAAKTKARSARERER